MKVKFANKIYEVLCSKEVAGKTIYAVEDEPNHVDWLVNVEVVDTEEELEDEKVRKEIIKLVKFYYGQTLALKHTVSRDKMLAWLEKQEEQKPVSITDEWIDDYWQHHKVINPHSYNKGEEIQFDYQGFVSFCKYITRLTWTEKQGEQKITNIDFKAKDWYVSKVDGKIHNASKIKPEFKVNDWITFYGDQSFKIIKIEAEINGVLNYLLLNQNGHCSYYGKKYVDENARLWTIKDAKEGDILANDHNILILKESVYDWYTNGTPYSVKAYCGIKPNGNFEIGIDNWSFCGTLHIHPATKEQRELLFQKMKEAGCEWDTEKKVLKEINPKFKVGDWIVFNGLTLYINEVVQGYYRTETKGGIPNSYDWDIDNAARLWTIEDAKEGDVLAIDWKYADDASKWQEIVIFKSLNENGVEGWGGTFKKNKNFALVSNNDFPYYSKTWSKYLKPASKEQCKILFKMLREKGYEWNADKKELVEL